MMMIRKDSFSAAHRLHNPRKSADWNISTYGKCNHPNFHGHNYTVEVAVRGPVDPDSGMVMNLTDLKQAIADVLLLVDHKNIDLDVAEFRDGQRISTSENVAIWLFEKLQARLAERSLAPQLLHRVRLWETDKNVFEYP